MGCPTRWSSMTNFGLEASLILSDSLGRSRAPCLVKVWTVACHRQILAYTSLFIVLDTSAPKVLKTLSMDTLFKYDLIRLVLLFILTMAIYFMSVYCYRNHIKLLLIHWAASLIFLLIHICHQHAASVQHLVRGVLYLNQC